MNEWIIRVDAVDRRLLLRVTGFRKPSLIRAMCLVTRLGDPSAVIAFSLLLLAPALTGWGSDGGMGVHAALALALSHNASQLLKRGISRPRPSLPVGLKSLIEAPDRFSFPSGHASATLSLALPIALTLSALGGLHGILGGFLVAVALLVGVSRAYLGVHFPGDVAAGWFLGLGSVLLAGWIL